MFLELLLMLLPRATWSALLVVLFRWARARPFPGLVGAGKAVLLELVLLGAIVVFHVLSWTVYPANRRGAFIVPYLVKAEAPANRLRKFTSV
jgi:hypothetical protein